MNKENIINKKVIISNIEKTYPEGTLYGDIVKEYEEEDNASQIILVSVNGRIQELFKPLKADCRIDFIRTDSLVGHTAYLRTATMIFLKAIHDLGEAGKAENVSLLFSFGAGYYFQIDGIKKPDPAFVSRVKQRMQSIVEAALPLKKESFSTDEAIEFFRDRGMDDKARLFHYRRVSRVNVYFLEDYADYYYGYMAPDTGFIRYFDLLPYQDGILLQLPLMEEPKVLPPVRYSPKLFEIQMQSQRWVDAIRIPTVGVLNDLIVEKGIDHVIRVQEALQEAMIANIAKQILDRDNIKFVMIAGPSSSGKTTFSRRLSVMLEAAGLRPHPIEVDNYFVNREDTPLDENGEKNFECLEAMDVEKFNQDMLDLLEGREVSMPTYNFALGKREYKGNTLKLEEEDILVLEGIHCLNDQFSCRLPKDRKFKIYISALTSLSIDNHNRIPTTDGRLLRRIVRDARTRGTSARETIARWDSVRSGEEANIFPYQEDADAMFNSALVYELASLKLYAEPLLFGIPKDAPEYIEAKRLLKFLDYFLAIPSEAIPTNSLLREFIG